MVPAIGLRKSAAIAAASTEGRKLTAPCLPFDIGQKEQSTARVNSAPHPRAASIGSEHDLTQRDELVYLCK